MLRDFVCFLRAIWSEWKVLLTGGTIFAALTVFSLSTGRTLPRMVNWLTLVVTLILAAFFAWRKEWVAGNSGLLDVTPDELVERFENRTTTQVKAMLTPYIGKRIKIRGTLSNVRAGVLFTLVSLNDFNEVRIYARIPPWKSKVFGMLTRGTVLTMAGRISDIESSQIELVACTLLEIEDPNVPISSK
jgi:hypothetical protein